MEIVWDIVEGSSVRKTAGGGLEIVRPVMVIDMPQNCTDGKNPAALVQALTAPGMPAYDSAHETITNAYLEDYNVRSIASADSVIVELIYKQRILDDGGHANSGNWSLTDSTQVSQLSTTATADGSGRVEVWYMPAAVPAGEGMDSGAPAGAQVRVVPTHRFKSHRIITASSVLRGSDWNSWKAQVRAASGKINSDIWGGEKRGTWLFVGPNTRYADPRRKTVTVQLTFMNDPNGFYPLVAYVNERGFHPADCSTEVNLRGTPPTPPPVGTIRRKNGLSLASVELETAFTPLFAFTPDL